MNANEAPERNIREIAERAAAECENWPAWKREAFVRSVYLAEPQVSAELPDSVERFLLEGERGRPSAQPEVSANAGWKPVGQLPESYTRAKRVQVIGRVTRIDPIMDHLSIDDLKAELAAGSEWSHWRDVLFSEPEVSATAQALLEQIVKVKADERFYANAKKVPFPWPSIIQAVESHLRTQADAVPRAGYDALMVQARENAAELSALREQLEAARAENKRLNELAECNSCYVRPAQSPNGAAGWLPGMCPACQAEAITPPDKESQ